jgi:hypothetical protein
MAEISDDQNAAVALARRLLSGKGVPEGFSKGGKLDLERAAKARRDLPPSGLPRSKFMPGVARAVHADGGIVKNAWGVPKEDAIPNPVKQAEYPYHLMAPKRQADSARIMSAINNAHGAAKIQHVNLSDLVSDQPTVGKSKLANPSDETPFAEKIGDQMHLRDGNHRVAAAIMRGEKSMPIKVADMSELLPDAPQKAAGGPVLRSKAAEIAASLPQASGTVEQMLAMLKKRGVKPAELDHAGAPGDLSGKITRDELAAHFRDRQPKVVHAENDGSEEDTRYPEYTAPGDGRHNNYREHRLILADKEPPEAGALQKRRDSMRDEMREALRNGDQEAYDRLVAEDKAIPAMIGAHQRGRLEERYKSSHWEDPNVLAHFRTTDRADETGGKHLNIEEIQSDWGQDGRKRGFRPAGSKAAAIVGDEDLAQRKMHAMRQWNEAEKDHENAHRAAYDVTDRLLKENPDAEFEHINSHPDMLKALEEEGKHKARADHWRDEHRKLEAMDNGSFTEARNDKRPPTAPYVTNTGSWVDLALKHVFHEAAKGGYDHVSFNPGEANAKMFGIEKHADELEYHPPSQRLLVMKDRALVHNAKVAPEDLPSYLGKETAEKLLASRPVDDAHSLRGGGPPGWRPRHEILLQRYHPQGGDEARPSA